MKSFILRRIIGSIIFLLLPIGGYTQQPVDSISVQKTNRNIGLALSGGGAKGLAHIGVLKVFKEEDIPVHMISGTSMGAIIGSLYAIGYTPEELEQIALTTNWDILFNDNYRFDPQQMGSGISPKDIYWFTFPFVKNRLKLPTGLTNGQNVSMMLYRLMLPYHNVEDFTQLPIPFSAVATNLSNGQSQAFTEGYLPNVVRASSAIPSIFKPVQINGDSYIDGGVARNIPAEDSRRLGADVVISSNVGEPIKPVDSLNTFVDMLFQSVGFHQQESDQRQIEKTDFHIQPDISNFSSFSYEKARRIIKKGEQAAREMLPEIRAYLKEHNVAPPAFEPITSSKSDSLLLNNVTYSNISGMLQRQTNLALNLIPPTKLTLAEIENNVNRLYSSNLFSQISYRLQDHPKEGKELILEFQQREQEQVGFSIRYDSKYRAALLFGLSLTDNILTNDHLDIRLRAGELLELSSVYSLPVTLVPLSEAKLGFNLQRSPIDFFNQQQRLSTVEVEQLRLRPHISINLWPTLNLQTGIEAEFYNLNEAVGNTLVLEDIHFLLQPFFEMQYTALNRPYFTTSGQSLHLKSTLTNRSWGSSFSFFQLSGKWFSAKPLSDRISLQSTFLAGYTSSKDIPLHYNYFLGGMIQQPVFQLHQHPLMGHAMQQLRSTNLWGLRSELQYKLTQSFYMKGGLNAAHLSDIWTFNIDSDHMNYGYSLSLGASTFIGPVELSVSTPNFTDQYAVKIDIGYNF